MESYHGGGLTYRGGVKSRDTDLIGIGIASAGFSATGASREEAVEIFYKTQITERITVQPDMMYIANPSGVNNDAFIVGLRSEIVF